MTSDKRATWTINTISVAVPLVVALLLGIRTKIALGDWTHYLPHAIGGINTLTSILLVAGWFAQRRKNIALHRAAMTSAVALGGLFLICYVTYHLSNESTRFGGQGLVRVFYYAVLLSHIGFSLIVLPLVLRAFLFAVTNQISKHRGIARYAYPIWLYVSVTGVIAYLMISPYYQHRRAEPAVSQSGAVSTTGTLQQNDVVGPSVIAD
jgi:putative membrane protein